MNHEELFASPPFPPLNTKEEAIEWMRWHDGYIVDPYRGHNYYDPHVRKFKPPTSAKGKDVKMVFYESEPLFLGYWLWSADHHDRYYVGQLVKEFGYTKDDFNKMEVVFFT
jgi:hypothetical protein